MWLRRLVVHSFAGIKHADIKLDQGLNVLYGPNELGKSTLVQAIRAALLLPDSSAAHRDLIDWHDDQPPRVELTVETDRQRIYRIKKSFGSGADGSSLLEFSKDGESFVLEAKGRDVDGQVRELLEWGIAQPGGGGGKHGWPEAFLTTALIGTQDEVEAVLERGLDGDANESGKQRLTRALQAMAESPEFRRVLAAAQVKVDEAYTPKGRRKRSKGSPWTEIQSRLKLARDEQDAARRLVNDSLSAGAGVEEIAETLAGASTQQAEAEAASQLLQVACRQNEARTAAARFLADAEKTRDRVQAYYTAVEETGAVLKTAEAALHDANAATAAAQTALDTAEEQVTAASKHLVKLESGSAEQERKIQRQEIEKKLLAFDAARKDGERELELANLAAVAHRKADELASGVEASEKRLNDAGDLLQRAETQTTGDQVALAKLEQLELADTLAAAIADLTTARADTEAVAKLRHEAAARRQEAQVIRSRIEALAVPDEKALSELGQQLHSLQIAEGKLQVGLSVRIAPKKPLDMSVAADSAKPIAHHLADEKTFEAEGHLIVDLAGIAEVEVTGGSAALRQEAQEMRQRWNHEVTLILSAAKVESFEQLLDASERATKELGQAAALDAEADQAEARARGAGDAETRLAVAERSEREARVQLDAQLTAGDSFERLLEEALEAGDPEAAEKERQALEQNIAKRNDQAGALRTQVARDESTLESANRELEAQRRDCKAADARLSGPFQDVLARAQGTLAKITSDRTSHEAELKKLGTSASATIDAAREKQEVAQTRADQARELLEQKTDAASKAQSAVTRSAAQLDERKTRAADEDLPAAERLVEELRKALKKLPRPTVDVDDEQLAAAHELVKRTTNAVRDLESERSKREGALETVGGQYIQDRLDRAEEAVESISDLEHLTEIEYSSWQLLLETLRIAESEDAVHLGDAVVRPIEERVAALTQGRYDTVSVGPHLDDISLTLAGAARDQTSLSIGTRDQLATLLRLTIAETLETAVILDDQLVHSDIGRMNRLAELIYRCADKSQILVFTCRREEYEVENYTAKANWVDLRRVVERSGADEIAGEV